MAKNYFGGVREFRTKRKVSDQDLLRLKNAAEVGLAVLASAGLVAMALVAPNLLGAIHTFNKVKKSWDKPTKEKSSRQTKRLVYYLKRHGYISLKNKQGVWQVALTKLGLKKVKEFNFENLTIPRGKKWDGKWWLAAADIPTKNHRAGADALRKKIKELGLFGLQKSLWMYPYNPSAEIEFISNLYRVANYVTVMEINRLDKDDERVLRRHFKSKGVI